MLEFALKIIQNRWEIIILSKDYIRQESSMDSVMVLTYAHQFFDILPSRVGTLGNSLAVQWLGLSTFTAKGTGSIPGRGTKIPQAAWCGHKKKKKKRVVT